VSLLEKKESRLPFVKKKWGYMGNQRSQVHPQSGVAGRIWGELRRSKVRLSRVQRRGTQEVSGDAPRNKGTTRKIKSEPMRRGEKVTQHYEGTQKNASPRRERRKEADKAERDIRMQRKWKGLVSKRGKEGTCCLKKWRKRGPVYTKTASGTKAQFSSKKLEVLCSQSEDQIKNIKLANKPKDGVTFEIERERSGFQHILELIK